MQHGMQGHVAEPRKPTRCLGGVEEAQARGGGHASPRGRPSGVTWQVRGLEGEGSTGSGPWLNNWGGNANALRRPTLYTRVFPLFSPCGTMFPLNFSFAGHVAVLWMLDAIALNKGHRLRGLESTPSPSKHVH